jgi:pyridoxal phosphate enzyme (YggS family)
MPDIAENLNNIRFNIEHAYQTGSKQKRSPTLIAVSKTKPVSDILKVWDAGQRDFGENKVQEAKEKFLPLRNQGIDFILHMIGPLQTNKVSEAVALFDVIHTVDRIKLAEALIKEMHKQQRYPDLLVQVNTGKEPQKSGVFPEDAHLFVATCLEMGLPVKGLMCIPPINEDPAVHFSLLADLTDKLSLPELSMGMSEDYELAIKHNATYVRVGSAIFGVRLR